MMSKNGSLSHTDLISVIVPVYNGEKYIDKCLQSILAQTYTNYEVIIVNDGSTDKSREILVEYEKNNENIHLINKENQGSSYARKMGLSMSKGKYIAFVDIDDWIEQDMLENLYYLCVENNTEISACGMIFEFGKKGIKQFKKECIPCVYTNEQALLELNKRTSVMVYLCNKLFEKSVFDNVLFREGNYIGEDYDTITQILCKKLTISWTTRCMYHYLQAEGTVSHAGFSEQHKRAYCNYQKRVCYLNEKFPKHKEYFENYVLTEYIMFVVAMQRGGTIDRELLQEIKQTAHKGRKQYCKASYIPLKFKISVCALCINYRFFVWGYLWMEKIRYFFLR